MKFDRIGFGREDLGDCSPKLALLSGEPERSRYIAEILYYYLIIEVYLAILAFYPMVSRFTDR